MAHSLTFTRLMHKFTIFTILLSIVVIVVVAELVISDYWGDDFASETQLQEETVEDPELRGDEEVVVEEEVPEESVEEEIVEEVGTEEEVVEETIEEPLEVVPESLISTGVGQMGLLEPVLETGEFEGLVYGFWDVEDDFADFTVMVHTIFDGTDYVGSVYEIQTDSEIQTFGAYEVLRQAADQSTEGEINENNAYGAASFYFNHSEKTQTVFLTVQKNGVVYAFEYGGAHHSNVKALIDLL